MKTRYSFIFLRKLGFGRTEKQKVKIKIKTRIDAENKIVLSQTTVILSVFGQSDFSMK